MFPVKQSLLLGVITLLSACGTHGVDKAIRAANAQNHGLAAEYSPFRYKVTVNDQGSGVATTEWAGIPGESITAIAPAVKSDIENVIKRQCDFDPEDLIATRLVSAVEPYFYEVWEYRDDLSKREDKTSGLSVIIEQLPNNGGVDFNLIGNCHAHPGTSFTFSN